MKDYPNIIWILLIVIGSAILSIASKAIKQKASKAIEQKQKKSIPAPSDNMPAAPESPVEVRQSVIADKMDAYLKHVEKLPSPKPKASKDIAPAHPQTPAPQAIQEHENSIAGDFDPRKAVIWSEILKPKYDEES